MTLGLRSIFCGEYELESAPEHSNDDGDLGDGDGDEDDNEGESASQYYRVGLRDAEKDPSGRTTCRVRGRNIPKGASRINYTVKPLSRMSDLVRAHATCAGGLPGATRVSDQRAVELLRLRSGNGDDDMSAILRIIASLLLQPEA